MITIATRLVKWRRYNLRLLDVPVRLKDHTVGIVELKPDGSEKAMVKAWRSEVYSHQSVVPMLKPSSALVSLAAIDRVFQPRLVWLVHYGI
jgi:hypothetical protein